ncbi:MAG: helix-turn-helix domain-containing protein [Candidatus Bathyarchaeia archaeon]
MISEERERAKPPENALREAGFTVSEKCCTRPSCFDFAARKRETLVFVKVHRDIDALSQNDFFELEKISNCVSATPILISENMRERPLEDDTVYSRYNIAAVTPKTFENFVVNKISPLIQAGPGGYYVEIDCEAIKRRRQELGLSVGEMAEMVGLSRRTLYGYERGMAKASVTAAYNLMCALGIPIAKPVNIFDKPRNQRKCFLTRAKRLIAKNKVVRRFLKKFSRCDITAVRKAPFDFVITVPEVNTHIIGGVASGKEQKLERRVDEIISVSKVVRAYPILVTNGQKPIDKDIPCVNSEEISKIKKPEDLINKF